METRIIKYSPNKGKKWTEIEFYNGSLSNEDIHDYIKESLNENGHDGNGIKFILFYQLTKL